MKVHCEIDKEQLKNAVGTYFSIFHGGPMICHGFKMFDENAKEMPFPHRFDVLIEEEKEDGS